MTENNFFQYNAGTTNVEPCELDDADYVCAELYRRLLSLYSDNLLYTLSLEDIIEDSGVDVNEIIEAKQSIN